MAYVPTPALLSEEASALPADQLAAHVDVAHEVLHLVGTAYDDAEHATLGHALALQVTYQVEAFPAAVLASEGAAGQSVSYRKAPDGSLPPAHPAAVVLVAAVAARAAAAVPPPAPAPAGAYLVVRSLR